MNRIFFSFLTNLFLIFFSCCEKELDPIVKPPVNSNKKELDTIWTKIIPADNSKIISRISMIPLLANDKIIVSAYDLFSSELEVISCFDKKNGNISWTWKNYQNSENGERGFGSTFFEYNVYNNILNYPSNFGNYFIDIQTGMTNNVFEFRTERDLIGDHSGGFAFYNELVFRAFQKNFNKPDCKSTIYMCSSKNPELLPIFSYAIENGFSPYINKPSIFLNQINDTLLLFQIGSINGTINRTDVICYNMSKKKVEWLHKDVASNLPTNIYNTIENDRFYFITQYFVHCYNILTGEKIWRYAISDFDGVYSPFVVENGKMYFGTGSGIIYCLDSRTGKLIWKFDSIGSENPLASPKQIKIFEDKLYYCDGRLAILDAKKGEMLHFYKSPYYYDKRYPDAFFDGINIDPVSRLMYLTDGHFLICARIPK